MLLLPVDPAYAFDYLAVLMVKKNKGLDVVDDLDRVERSLLSQLGQTQYYPIMSSPEFNGCFQANLEVFDAIEKAHQGRIGARKVQEINHKRFEAKRSLQERFWPEVPITERKTMVDKPKRRFYRPAKR